MAGAHTKHHDYHLVDPSPWPLVGAASATIMAIGAVMWMKAMPVEEVEGFKTLRIFRKTA